MSRKCSRKKKIDRAVDDEVYSELLPADKVEKVEELIQIKSEKENMMVLSPSMSVTCEARVHLQL